MEKCNCQCGQEVVYLCKTEKCPNYRKQKVYCLECSQDSKKHNHRPILIVKELEIQNQQWKDLKSEIKATYDETSKRYKAMEPLIKYLEEAMIDP